MEERLKNPRSSDVLSLGEVDGLKSKIDGLLVLGDLIDHIYGGDPESAMKMKDNMWNYEEKFLSGKALERMKYIRTVLDMEVRIPEYESMLAGLIQGSLEPFMATQPSVFTLITAAILVNSSVRIPDSTSSYVGNVIFQPEKFSAVSAFLLGWLGTASDLSSITRDGVMTLLIERDY